MRKISMLLTTLVLAALVLAACGGQETSTNVPSTNFPSTTSEATATEVGTATEMPTEIGGATETPGVPVTGETNPARLSNELDFTVQDQNGQQLGDVQDMVLDLDNTMVAYVVVATSDGRTILVPWDSLQLQTGTGGQQNAFILQSSVDLSAAPEFDLSNLPQMGQPADNWDADIQSFWQSGGATAATSAPGTTATSEATAAATELATATEAPGTSLATATAGTGTGMGTGHLQGVVLATDLLGSTVTLGNQGTGTGQGLATATTSAGSGAGTTTETPTAVGGAGGTGLATATPGTGTGSTSAGTATAVPATGTEVGGAVGVVTATMDDAIIDTTNGNIMYFVLNTTSDTGQRLVPAPLSAFSWDTSTQGFILNADAATLQNAPSFQNDQYPDTTVSGWNSEFDTFWQNNGMGTGTGVQATPTP